MQDLEAQRFWRHVAGGSIKACWLWQGHVDSAGYGRFFFQDGSQERAHRAAFALTTQQTLEKHCVIRQRCGERLCCNPHHLCRGRRQTSRPGELHGRAKLTWRIVRLIRASSNVTGRELAARFEVSESTVSRVLTGKIWVE